MSSAVARSNAADLIRWVAIAGQAVTLLIVHFAFDFRVPLLPAFAGLHTHQRAIDAGCKFAGVTVHQVTAELDVGPILDQAVVPVLPDDTAQTLAARVLTQEHRIYPEAVAAFLKGLA